MEIVAVNPRSRRVALRSAVTIPHPSWALSPIDRIVITAIVDDDWPISTIAKLGEAIVWGKETDGMVYVRVDISDEHDVGVVAPIFLEVVSEHGCEIVTVSSEIRSTERGL